MGASGRKGATLGKVIAAGLLAGTVLLTSTAANAALLGLTKATPDLLSGFVDIVYDANLDLFTASGFALELDDDGVGAPEAIAGGTFDITATIDGSGNATAGSLTIGGTIASLGFNSGTLLTGTVSAFGFTAIGGDPLEFIFTVTGGDAASLYGTDAGVILSDAGFTGSFASNFDNGGIGAGVSDTIPVPVAVPEPDALWLFGLGLLGLTGFAWRGPRRVERRHASRAAA